MDEIGTAPPRWWQHQRRQLKLAIITGIVVILAAGGITGYLLWPHSPASQTRTSQPAPPPVQTVLPFAGLNNPRGVAVDSAGNLYVTDPGNNRVVKLAAG